MCPVWGYSEQRCYGHFWACLPFFWARPHKLSQEALKGALTCGIWLSGLAGPETAFLTSSQVKSVPLVRGPHFKEHVSVQS